MNIKSVVQGFILVTLFGFYVGSFAQAATVDTGEVMGDSCHPSCPPKPPTYYPCPPYCPPPPPPPPEKKDPPPPPPTIKPGKSE